MLFLYSENINIWRYQVHVSYLPMVLLCDLAAGIDNFIAVSIPFSS